MDTHASRLPMLACSLDVLAFIALFIVTILLSLELHRRKARKDEPRLPPGPWRLPVIGSLHHLLLTKHPRLVHRTLADLARRCNAPVMYLRLGELPAVVISSPEAAEEVMRTHDVTFATRAKCVTVRATVDGRTGVTFTPYGDLWRRLRRICSAELLGAARVLSFRPIREDEASRLAAALAASPPGELVNVSKAITAFLADSTVRAVVGERLRRREARDELAEVMDKALKKASGFNLGDLFPSSRLARKVDGSVGEMAAFAKKMDEIVGFAIAQCQERMVAGEDAVADAKAGESINHCMLHALMRMHKEGDSHSHLPLGTIRLVVSEMFTGGTLTTATVLHWVMTELMRNPTVMCKAQAEIRIALQGKSRVTEDDLIALKYLKCVIKETMRMHPAAPLLVPRECQESCNILAYNIPAGTTVFVNAYAIGRDPRYWEDAEAFKPERFEHGKIDFKGANFELIPFGAGRRICPGIAFSQPNIELALAVLLYHFDWQLPHNVTPYEMDIEEEFGITVCRKRDLYLRPILRVPPKALG